MRLATRAVAVLLGLVLLVGGLGLALEIALTALTGGSTLVPYDNWLRYGRDTSWDARAVTLTGLGLLVAGVVMLVLCLRRRAPLAVPGRDRDLLHVTFARRPLEQAVSRLAQRSAGVEDVSVHLRRRKAEVRGASLATDLEGNGALLRDRLASGLDRLPLADSPTVDVRLRRART